MRALPQCPPIGQARGAHTKTNGAAPADPVVDADPGFETIERLREPNADRTVGIDVNAAIESSARNAQRAAYAGMEIPVDVVPAREHLHRLEPAQRKFPPVAGHHLRVGPSRGTAVSGGHAGHKQLELVDSLDVHDDVAGRLTAANDVARVERERRGANAGRLALHERFPRRVQRLLPRSLLPVKGQSIRFIRG